MPDDKSKAGSADRDRINIKQYYERRDWAVKFGVTQGALREAVQAVGPMVKDVKAYLIKKIENV